MSDGISLKVRAAGVWSETNQAVPRLFSANYRNLKVLESLAEVQHPLASLLVYESSKRRFFTLPVNTPMAFKDRSHLPGSR